MSKKTSKPARLRMRGLLSRLLLRARRCSRKLLHALVSRRVVAGGLTAIIAVELAVLGVGVTRRLDMAYERSLEVSRAHLAVIEAREFDRQMEQAKGSAGVTATPSAQEETDPDAPPPLRARDVDTILAQEGGFDFMDLGTEEPAPAPATEPVIDEITGKLSPEDREELDKLIRQGVAAMTAGDMRQCVLSLEEACLLCAEHPAMLYYYGMAYDKLLNPKKAREYYTKVFQMRDRAGNYFKRAAHRLTYGFDQPAAMRGKLSFGPHQLKHTYAPDSGEQVDLLLPVMLAPGEDVRLEDLYIHVQFFDLVNGRRIGFSRGKVNWNWQNEKPDWSQWEENLVFSYSVPPLTQEEMDVYGDIRYYGFTAKLYYKGEPLDCLSTPSSLILHEHRLKSRSQQQHVPSNSLLPDDGLVPEYEEALPASDFLPELPLPQ